MQNTLFISDTHLCDRYPQITQTLTHYLETNTTHTDAVYLLGDLFDVWIGDDVQSQAVQALKRCVNHLYQRGIPCFFIHGNRDFLLREDFAQQAKLNLLPEHHRINLYDVPTLLLHGDTLCTFDKSYQKLRKVLRNPLIQSVFLRLPKYLRHWIGVNMRAQSRQYNRYKASEKMDINPNTLVELCKQYDTEQLIHGHIHQPKVDETGHYKRFVLGDWANAGSVLVYSADHNYELLTLPLLNTP